MRICTAYMGLGLSMYKSISEKYYGPEIPKDVYFSAFDKASSTYKNEVGECIECLDISRQLLRHDLNSHARTEENDGNMDKITLVSKERIKLEHITYTIKDN